MISKLIFILILIYLCLQYIGSSECIIGQLVKLPVREGSCGEENAFVEGSTLRFCEGHFRPLGLEF